MSIKESLKATKAYSTFLNMRRFHEIRIFWGERFKFCKEARKRFASEKPDHGSYKDYKKALWKHRVTYSEYMYSYEYWHLDEKERDEFISTSEMQVIYRKLGEHEVRNANTGLSQSAFGPGLGEYTERIIKELWPRQNNYNKNW